LFFLQMAPILNSDEIHSFNYDNNIKKIAQHLN
jgi:hypothetical protein